MAEIIEMPKLSDTMETGTLVKWLKNEGDSVTNGDALAEVETDKATMELENFEEGVILKQYVSEGDEVPIGAPVCAIGEKGEDAPEVSSNGSGEAKKQKTAAKEDKAEEPEEDTEEKTEEPEEEITKAEESKAEKPAKEESSEDEEPPDGIKASPLARKIAEKEGLDLTKIKGTGPGGRIVKDDVLRAKDSKPSAEPKSAPASKDEKAEPAGLPIASLEDKEIKVSNMRKSIAKALVKSKAEAPHFYLTMEVDAAPMAKLRKNLNTQLAGLPAEQGGIKFTINDLILKACAEAVRRVPAINRSWADGAIRQYGAVHLAFGVAIDEGLITPVIRDAERKSLRQISTEAKELIDKARNKKLKPEEMQNSTLTVTNLGMFGITDFYGILNPPNAAILSFGASLQKPVVNEKGEIVVGTRMNVGISGDHRVIDGALGAEYLGALRYILETPEVMLV